MNPDRDDDHFLGRSPRFQALLNRSRESIAQGKALSEAAFWKAVRERARQRDTRTMQAELQKGKPRRKGRGEKD